MNDLMGPKQNKFVLNSQNPQKQNTRVTDWSII